MIINEGINFIKTDSNIELPVFYSKGKNQKSKVLWILFSAGGPRRKSKNIYPLFDRISWVKDKFKSSCLIFEDPSYHYNKGIQDGWYLGNQETTYFELIVEYIKQFISAHSLSYETLRFFGSSTGGTAAIWISNHFPGSICIASNPQVDISIWPTYTSTCNILNNKNTSNRNIREMIHNPNNRLFISINIADNYDQKQAIKLIDYLNELDNHTSSLSISKEGIEKVNNKFIWFYHIKTTNNNPHNILPLFGMLIAIESLFFHHIPQELLNINLSVYKQFMLDYYELYDKFNS